MLSSLLVALSLIASVTAAPASGRDRLRQRNLRRANGGRAGGMNDRTSSAADKNSVSTSSNWSGAVLEGNNWKTVSGTITMPTPKVPSGGSSRTTYSASAWVGIDGDKCQSALWQTGVDFNVRGKSVSYDAWWEWIPNAANFFNGISFSAGDTVFMTVTATSKTRGTATITNQSTGKTVSKTTTGPAPLCLTDAEWIVEDFSEGGGLVPLANWGSITFNNATATTSSGTTSGPANADIIQLKTSNGKIVTKTTVTSTSVTDTYTG